MLRSRGECISVEIKARDRSRTGRFVEHLATLRSTEKRRRRQNDFFNTLLESRVPGSGIQRVRQGILYFGKGKGEAILQQPLRR